jgi:hypothetical protein
LRTNCVQNKEDIEDFTWRVSDCEELVGAFTGDYVIDIVRNIFI